MENHLTAYGRSRDGVTDSYVFSLPFGRVTVRYDGVRFIIHSRSILGSGCSACASLEGAMAKVETELASIRNIRSRGKAVGGGTIRKVHGIRI